MRILYGSQNFGYDISESDIDYVDILVPSLDDLIYRRKLYGQVRTDTGIIKQYDVRCFNNIANGESFSDAQILFSKQYSDDCSELSQLLDIRGKILVANKWGLFKKSCSVINNSLRENTSKGLTRAYVFIELLKRVLEQDRDIQSFYVDGAKSFRLRVIELYSSIGDLDTSSYRTLDRLKSKLCRDTGILEEQFRKFDGSTDADTINEVYNIVSDIIKKGIVS